MWGRRRFCWWTRGQELLHGCHLPLQLTDGVLHGCHLRLQVTDGVLHVLVVLDVTGALVRAVDDAPARVGLLVGAGVVGLLVGTGARVGLLVGACVRVGLLVGAAIMWAPLPWGRRWHLPPHVWRWLCCLRRPWLCRSKLPLRGIFRVTGIAVLVLLAEDVSFRGVGATQKTFPPSPCRVPTVHWWPSRLCWVFGWPHHDAC